MKLLMLSKMYDAGRNYLQNKIEFIDCLSDDSSPVMAYKDVDGIFLGNQKLSRETIFSCPNLKFIAKQGSGFDNIDVNAATERGIPVILSAGVNASAVAEHVMLLVLSCCRNLIRYDRAVRIGNYSQRSTCQEIECRDKVFGLVGLGRIGRLVANYAKAFGLKVIVYDPAVNDPSYVNCSSLKELLSAADIVSLHVPLVKETRGMIGRDEIATMKDNAILVNCARGGLVDESALYDALITGKLYSAGIDVWETEPVSKDNPLLSLDNVIATPHSAALTKESADAMSLGTAKGIEAIINGKKWEIIANPVINK